MAVGSAVVLGACSLGPGGHPRTNPLRIAVSSPSSLDPAFLRDRDGILIARQLFETLVKYDHESSGLLPGLADSWEVLDDGTRFVFHLRAGAKFHNGTSVTARDVEFSLDRLANKDTGSENSFLLDAIAGFDDSNRLGKTPELSGVAAIDERTLEIRLAAPWVDFPYVLTNPATAPVPAAEVAADPEGFGKEPIGNGPYRMAAPLSDSGEVELVRFIGFKGERGNVPGVRFVVYDEPEVAWRDFESGGLDVAEAPPGRIPFAAAAYGRAGYTPLAAGLYLSFNVRKRELREPALRQAVSLAIDRDPIVNTIYSGALTSARGLVPLGVAGGGEPACGRFCTFDPEGAKAILQENYPNGPPRLALDFPSGVTDEALGGHLKQNLAEVGLELELRPRDRELHSYLDLLQAGQQEIFRLAWPAEYPAQDWFLNPLFRSASPDNHSGFEDRAVDELLASARGTLDQAERTEAYRLIEKRVMDELVVIPLGFFRNHYLASSRVGGFYVDQLGGFELADFQVSGP